MNILKELYKLRAVCTYFNDDFIY